MAGLAPNSDIMSRVAEITATDSPIMRQAAAKGAATANRRGMINSSIGIGATQDAIIGAAVPIASQESSQAATAENLAKQIASNEGMAARDITSREKISGDTIRSNEGISARDLTSRETLTREQLAGADRERLITAQINASSNYSQALANTINNDKIPATTRTQVQTALLQQYNDSIAAAMRIYGLSTPAPAAPQPAMTTPYNTNYRGYY